MAAIVAGYQSGEGHDGQSPGLEDEIRAIRRHRPDPRREVH
jgi:hypothetical protein